MSGSKTITGNHSGIQSIQLPIVGWTATTSASWYHLGPKYGGKEGDRINDHHLNLEKKQKARAGLITKHAEGHGND